MLCYIGNKQGQNGVGFLIGKIWQKNLLEFRGISDRLALAKFQTKTNNSIVPIQIYAPTAQSSETESDMFYHELTETLETITDKKTFLLIVGDFNSQVGKRMDVYN